ncbi:hypothetical protein QQF64_021839 [Cirrhinus molitorella]|uniref:Uncharacterized protein n=1 Tax=Cirrhinus molitorella TaxID=172907 RepID=A0ABR3L8S2_9TELE
MWRFFTLRSADPIVNRKSSLVKGVGAQIQHVCLEGRRKARGLPGRFGSELFGHDKSVRAGKREGVTLSKTLTPAEELQAFPVFFCPFCTCDCIAVFLF